MQKKHLVKFNTLVWLKTLNKLGVGENCLNIIKSMCEKTHSEHDTQWWKIESFLSKIRNRNNTKMPTFATSIQHSTGGSIQIK